MYAALDDPEQYLVHDMQFHQTIAAASDNRILTSLMNMIATILFVQPPQRQYRVGVPRLLLEHCPQLLDRQGIAIRAGHHCAMPLHKRLGISASSRASFYFYNTEAEVHRLGQALEETKRIFRRK